MMGLMAIAGVEAQSTLGEDIFARKYITRNTLDCDL